MKQFLLFILLFGAVQLSAQIGVDYRVDASSDNTPQLTSVDEDLALYPNPTTDYFKIMNDQNVHTVIISNIVGRQINKFNHERDQVYYVDDLRKGIYLIRLFDEGGNALKALRLSKD